MPGLVAIMAEPNHPELGESLDACLAAMTHPGHVIARVVLPEMGLALGHVGPARVSTMQPGFANDDRVVAILEGEPLGLAEVGRTPARQHHSAPAAIIAELYANSGMDSVIKLSGHWSLVILDRAAHQVIIANDVFGVRPLYQTQTADGTTIVASHPAAILAHPNAQRAIAPAGLADYLAFGYVLGDKTLFEDMRLLPPATLSVWDGQEMTQRRYWLPRPVPAHDVDLAELELIRQIFNEQVASMAAAGGPFSLALTGGRDSRAILSAMLVAGYRPTTMTHTIPNAGDSRIAAQLAQIAGVPHHFYEVRGEDLPAQIASGVTMLGGQVANIDVHPLCFLSSLTDFTHVMFTGMGGDVIQMNYGVAQGIQRAGSMPELIGTTLAQYNRLFLLSGDFPELLSIEWREALRDMPEKSVTEALAGIDPQVPAGEKSGVFYLQERIRKFLTKGDALVRRELETRHPFMTSDVLMAGWHLPMSARAAGLAHSYIITRNAPALADVPVEMTGEPIRFSLTPPPRWQQKLETLRRLFRRRGRSTYERVPNYRYGDWLRGPLRPLVTDVLLDARTRARPYFNQTTIQRWLDEHMAGGEHTAKLAALVALELTIRSLIEQDAN